MPVGDEVRRASRIRHGRLARPVTIGLLTLVYCGALLGANAASAQDGAHQAPSRAQLIAYAKCMRAHGIKDFPYPGGQRPAQPGREVNPHNARFRAAAKACSRFLPTGEGTGEVKMTVRG